MKQFELRLYLNVNGVPLLSVIIQLDLLYLVAVMKNKKRVLFIDFQFTFNSIVDTLI
jgi:hypothetical protein